MAINTTTENVKEICTEGHGITVSINPWGNMEGANCFVVSEGQDQAMRCSFSMRWEEIDTLLVALIAARAG